MSLCSSKLIIPEPLATLFALRLALCLCANPGLNVLCSFASIDTQVPIGRVAGQRLRSSRSHGERKVVHLRLDCRHLVKSPEVYNVR
jgi:hypothetical protein